LSAEGDFFRRHARRRQNRWRARQVGAQRATLRRRLGEAFPERKVERISIAGLPKKCARARPVAEAHRLRRVTHRIAKLPGHKQRMRSSKFMAATTTQSVAITCAQIATIPTNSASEASVAISSTMARPMLLTRQCPKIQRVRMLNAPFPGRPWERLSFHWSRW
jgi:hypothetical protein